MFAKYQKKAMKYFGKHPNYNASVHMLSGISVGIIITYPLVGGHPLRWAVFFLLLSVLGHLWAAQQD